ncbi:MAG: transcriptional regulator, LysR family [Caulobacter sp.]|nr:transcriptional regulator, LysR family [Caulobacter sp.]
MARTGRATLAAEELCVTHSAVSRQVKALERGLGVALFSGPKHALRLTAAGQDLLAGLTPAFDAIAAAALRARSQTDDLTLAVNASTSVKWLIPRLGRFAAARPAVRLRMLELAPYAYGQRGAHAVVRIVRPEHLGPGVTVFMPNAIGPVIAPQLLAEAGDILAAPRLVAGTHAHGWAEWADATGARLPPVQERIFAHLHFALDAALAGLGAVVLPWPLVADEVAAGRLAAPLPFAPREGGFAVMATPGVESRALVQFTAWLKDEGAAMAPAPG